MSKSRGSPEVSIKLGRGRYRVVVDGGDRDLKASIKRVGRQPPPPRPRVIICAHCGRERPAATSGPLPKRPFCSQACRVALCRAENPEHARELARAQYRRRKRRRGA